MPPRPPLPTKWSAPLPKVFGRTVPAITRLNQQLHVAIGLLSVTVAALATVADDLAALRSQLVQLGDGGLSEAGLDQLGGAFAGQLSHALRCINGAAYRGRSLIGHGATSVTVIGDDRCDLFTLSPATPLQTLSPLGVLAGSVGRPDPAAAEAAIAPGGTYDAAVAAIAGMLDAYVALAGEVAAATGFNQAIADNLPEPLRPLVDVGLEPAAALATAGAIRPRLAVERAAIANQAPKVLLGVLAEPGPPPTPSSNR